MPRVNVDLSGLSHSESSGERSRRRLDHHRTVLRGQVDGPFEHGLCLRLSSAVGLIAAVASTVPWRLSACLDPGATRRQLPGATPGLSSSHRSSSSRSDGGRRQDAGEGGRLSSGGVLVVAATATAAPPALGLLRGLPSAPPCTTAPDVPSASWATTAAASDALGGRGGGRLGASRSCSRGLPCATTSPVSFHFSFTWNSRHVTRTPRVHGALSECLKQPCRKPLRCALGALYKAASKSCTRTAGHARR